MEPVTIPMKVVEQSEAWKLAQKLGIVPVFHPEKPKPPAKSGEGEADRYPYRDEFRKALLTFEKEFKSRIAEMDPPPDPGPKPEEHEPPPMPKGGAKDDRQVATDWARDVNDPWIDSVYYPHEAERIVWVVAMARQEQWHLDKKAAVLLAEDERQKVEAERQRLERIAVAKRERIMGWALIIYRIGIAVVAVGAGIYFGLKALGV